MRFDTSCVFFTFLFLSACAKPLTPADKVSVFNNIKGQHTLIKTFSNGIKASQGQNELNLELNLTYASETSSFGVTLSFLKNGLSFQVAKGDKLTLYLDGKTPLTFTCSQTQLSKNESLEVRSSRSRPSLPSHPNTQGVLSNSTSLSMLTQNAPLTQMFAHFPVTKQQMKQILESRSIAFEMKNSLLGPPIEGNFSSDNLALIKAFKDSLLEKSAL